MKNIFILIPNLGGGGAERVITTIVNYINPKEWNVTLVVLQSGNSVYSHFVPQYINFIQLNYSRVRYSLPKLILILWQKRPAIVLSTLGHLNLALSIVRFILPRQMVFIARESSIVSFMNKYQSYQYLLSWLYRIFYKKYDSIVCQSNFMALDLIEQFNIPKHKIEVICNPIDTPRVIKYSKMPISASSNVENWCNYKGVKLLAVGRLSPEKGFDLLIDAINLCRDLHLQLLILGSGPLLDQLTLQINRLNLSHIILLNPFLENPYPLMASSDGFILSSHFEGFPNAVLEAVSLGTPVIATPAPGGLTEIIRGIEGCYMASEINSKSLAAELRKWYNSSRKRIPNSETSNFNATEIVPKYENLFLKIINGR